MLQYVIYSLVLSMYHELMESPPRETVGTDLRKAVFDGFPANRLIGVDLFPEFIETGYRLWQDRPSCGI